jgi:hypothetical protein
MFHMQVKELGSDEVIVLVFYAEKLRDKERF